MMKKSNTESKVHRDLKTIYVEDVKPLLIKNHPDLNIMEIPVLEKIVLNMGLGQARDDRKAAERHAEELAAITGQKPKETKAKKSISNFKLREDEVIGLMVTLRGKRMYQFLDRFINIAAPRIRDFRGFPRNCDGQGNYTFGLTDQQIFPEVDPNKVTRAQGMDVTIVTTAKSDDLCRELLELLGFKFKTDEKHAKS